MRILTVHGIHLYISLEVLCYFTFEFALELKMQEQQYWHTWQDRSTSLSKLLWFYCQNLPNAAKKSLGNGLHGCHFAIPLVFDGLCASGYVCSVDGSLSQRASGESVLHFPRLEVFGRGLREHGTVKGDQGTYFEVKFELCEPKWEEKANFCWKGRLLGLLQPRWDYSLDLSTFQPFKQGGLMQTARPTESWTKLCQWQSEEICVSAFWQFRFLTICRP